MTDFGGKTSCAVNCVMYMHSGFSQKSVLKPQILYLDFEMVKSGWDKRPCRSEPLLAKIRTHKIYIAIYLIIVWFIPSWLGMETITVIFWQEPHLIYSLCSGLKIRKRNKKV